MAQRVKPWLRLFPADEIKAAFRYVFDRATKDGATLVILHKTEGRWKAVAGFSSTVDRAPRFEQVAIEQREDGGSRK